MKKKERGRPKIWTDEKIKTEADALEEWIKQEDNWWLINL